MIIYYSNFSIQIPINIEDTYWIYNTYVLVGLFKITLKIETPLKSNIQVATCIYTYLKIAAIVCGFTDVGE